MEVELESFWCFPGSLFFSSLSQDKSPYQLGVDVSEIASEEALIHSVAEKTLYQVKQPVVGINNSCQIPFLGIIMQKWSLQELVVEKGLLLVFFFFFFLPLTLKKVLFFSAGRASSSSEIIF